jgi:hypothetical protein
MKNSLEELIGLRVAKAELVHDYLHLVVGESAGIRVFNDYVLTGPSKLPSVLIGLMLTQVHQDESEVVLSFEGDIKLVISLLPEAYKGPEAIVLNRDGAPPVVWN